MAFLSSFCLALFTDAKLLSLVSISSLKALETVSFFCLLFVPNLDFLSPSLSPFSFLVALCSASFRLSKSFVATGGLGANDGFNGAPLLNVEVVFGLNVPGLDVPLLLGKVLDFFSITTEFFP